MAWLVSLKFAATAATLSGQQVCVDERCAVSTEIKLDQLDQAAARIVARQMYRLLMA